MRTVRWSILFLACAFSVTAQQAPLEGPERQAVLRQLDASYYHPDNLASIECNVGLDFSSVIAALGGNADAAKSLSGISIKVKAARGEITKLEVSWPPDTKLNKEQMQQSLQQMVGGFFQMYWSVFAASIVTPPADAVSIEPRAGGGYTMHQRSNNMDTLASLDQDFLPNQLELHSAVMNGTMDFHFSASENPQPGDLRRITGLDVSQQVASSSMQIKIDLDYQRVDGLAIPHRVSMGLGRGMTVGMELTGCSVSRR
ncbi:MAG TPA: hypothetical protein VEF06_07215 [Bryobacteraceae bacterium]|nr:hypothetical protein [Bryobacteraceae bacterium]